MNNYFVNDNPFVPGTIARAEEVNDKFTAVETGFELVETTKSKKTGDTYTGTHDLTGAITLVAAPTEASHPTTKLYADNLAFQAGTFPDQAGNAGKIITTDGTSAFWSDLDGGTF